VAALQRVIRLESTGWDHWVNRDGDGVETASLYYCSIYCSGFLRRPLPAVRLSWIDAFGLSAIY
jgi:hypothetical protein